MMKVKNFTILSVLLVIAGCASINEARTERFNRHYIGELEKVTEDARMAFINSGIGVDQVEWIEANKEYQISGTVRIHASSARRLTGSQEGMLSIGKVVMKLKYIEDGVVFTQIDTIDNKSHAMASSADRDSNTVGNLEEDIYRILDRKYERIDIKTTEES